jgi:hypothetical protein
VVLQSIEPVVPVAGERGEELLRELERCGPQVVADSAAFARLGGHKASAGHEGEVPGDGLAGDRRPRCQAGGRGRPAGGEGGGDYAAGRVSQGGEHLLGHGLDVRRH